MGDIITISQLAIRVYTAYQDAPDEYKHISEEVRSLQIVIDEAIQYFESSTLSDNKRYNTGQEVLQGCRSILEDLDSLIEKHKSIASAKRWQFLKRVKFSNNNIMDLRTRLISNTLLLGNFIRRFVLAI